jgi:RHS repeat-associated protein
VNPVRFSSKFTDEESGQVYYGARSYAPALGRWLNRDPLGEQAGLNLYALLRNDAVNQADPIGLDAYDDYVDNIELYNAQGYTTSALNSYIPLPLDPRITEALSAAGEAVLSPGLAIHTGLDVVGMIEGFGLLADAINAGLYALEGNSGLAVGSALAAVPILGTIQSIKKLGNAADAAADAAKTGQNLLNPGINVTERGMQHVLERHIVNGIPEFASKSKFTTGVNLTELIQQGTQMPMVRQANGNFARTFDAGRAIGIDRATGQASSTVTIITAPNGNLVTMFPGVP